MNTIYLEKFYELFDRDIYKNIVVIAHAYGKIYILCQWIGKSGDFDYGFKPINSIAYYEYGLGTTECYNSRPKNYNNWIKESKLYRYLKETFEKGTIYYYNSLYDAINCSETRATQIIDDIDIPEIEVTIKVNGKKVDEPLSIETAKRLGIIK